MNSTLVHSVSKETIESSIETIVGLSYALLITQDIHTSLAEWCQIKDPPKFMEAFCTNWNKPTILQDNDQSTPSIRIGSIKFQRPTLDEWNTASFIAKYLGPSVAAMTLGTQAAFENGIIEFKSSCAAKSNYFKNATIKFSSTCADIIEANKDTQGFIEYHLLKKKLYQSVRDKLHKQTALHLANIENSAKKPTPTKSTKSHASSLNETQSTKSDSPSSTPSINWTPPGSTTPTVIHSTSHGNSTRHHSSSVTFSQHNHKRHKSQSYNHRHHKGPQHSSSSFKRKKPFAPPFPFPKNK